MDLQRIVSSDIGFKGRFLLRMELPDPKPFELARSWDRRDMGEGLTAWYIADAISSMGEDWRVDRNGRVADDLVHSIRMEVRKKAASAGNDVATMSPSMSLRMPIVMHEEVTITVEDFQNGKWEAFLCLLYLFILMYVLKRHSHIASLIYSV